MENQFENRNKRYKVYRSNTPSALERGKSITDIDISESFAEVKPATSPNFKLVVALVVVSVIVVGGIAAVVVVKTTGDDEGEKTTVSPAKGQQSTTRSSTTKTTLTTRATTVTTITPTVTPDVADGLWSLWGDWTRCTATCDAGLHKRYRSCNHEISSECIGDFVETEVCEEAVCSVYGKWTSWESWGSCDTTCGGGSQTRYRTCSKVDSTDVDCVGSNSKQKTCSDWNCPDCSTLCVKGILNTDCDTCVCEDTVIIGRVTSNSTGNPISNAALYASTAPTKILTQSNSTGFFTLDTTCTETEMIVTRDGFVDQRLVVSSSDLEIQMVLLVLPYLTETPQSKYRLSGEDVTFCCKVIASPSVDYYEWFKDGIVLDESQFPDGNMLSLSDLTITKSGQYQCRANSPAGAIMSPAATLTIKERSNEFCSDALQQKTIALPDDCVQSTTNTATYNVGECISKTCRENNTAGDSGTCRENRTSCCIIDFADLETVQCSGYELELVVVRSCGCGACTQNSITISGTALGAEDKSPLKFGEVWVNGVFTSYTSISGDFTFVALKTTSKLNINLKDTYFKLFLPAIKVIDINDEFGGVLRIDINMIHAAQPVEIDSKIENTLVAGSSVNDASTSVLQVSIPANAFYFQNGTQYQGIVEASLTFLDPTNTSILQNIPGTFNIVDEEGQTANLASLGVFNLYFEDSLGQPLVLDEVLDVYIPFELGDDVTNNEVKLWGMNADTGVWEYVTPGTGARRRKRSSSAKWIGEIDWTIISSQKWLNLDYIEKSPYKCFFKVRLFRDDTLLEHVNNIERYIYVDYHILRSNTLISARNYFYYSGDECEKAKCEDDNAYISIYYYDRKGYKPLYAGPPIIGTSNDSYEIMDDDKVLKIQMSASSNGPFYGDKEKCLSSDSTEYHLRFRIEKTTDVFTFQKTYTPFLPSSADAIQTQISISQKTWYPARSSEGYRVCFMKVRFQFESINYLSFSRNIKVRVKSYGGTNENIKDFVLGIREYDVTEAVNSSICVEYKCSGTIDPVFDQQFDYTRVVLYLDYPTSELECRITGESDFISSDQTSLNEVQIGRTSGKYEIYTPSVYTPDIGLYSSTSDKFDIDSATNTAEGECRSGKPHNLDDDNPDIGVAVSFTFTFT